IFYAHIGGVPYQLLHFDPNDSAKSQLTTDDWVKILGAGKANFDPMAGGQNPYDETGIDAHMIEAFAPRSGLPIPSSPDTADPIPGREWVTDANWMFVARQFSCTFPLATARDCTLPANQAICDCPSMAAGVNHDQVPPVCNSADVTKQVKAK